MTYSNEPKDPETRRRRITFRAWHRGIKENDLILGTFADMHIETLNDDDLDAFEQLMEAPDQDVYGWVSQTKDVPPEYQTNLMTRLQAHTVPPRTRLER
ncbi:succinate dehydrogenase assembly factor 2 [Pyruvatibacter sp.]|uniref:succinate dehydrogenase assembly factor 2 n=1 Tax=Pyruvatibacter sp. TaxID=1981328 RepID=UPI0032EEA1A9